MALEAFVNNLLKVACVAMNHTFASKQLSANLTELMDVLRLDKKGFYRSGLKARLDEFAAVRNELIHDRHFGRPLELEKTGFSPVPNFANQADLIECAIISLDLFGVFRYVYPGLDLMPDIFIQVRDSFAYLKLDVLYERVLRPMYRECLQKHGLESSVQLEPITFKFPSTTALKPGIVRVLIKAVPDLAPDHKLDTSRTEICRSLFNAVKADVDLDTSMSFRLPRYLLDARKERNEDGPTDGEIGDTPQ